MADLNEEKVESEIVIDFGQLRNPDLKESFLLTFGSMVKGLLKAIFGQTTVSANVRGEPREIAAFAKALRAEKDYLSVLKRYDLDNPRTHKNKAKLKSSVKSFERETGVSWPFEV